MDGVVQGTKENRKRSYVRGFLQAFAYYLAAVLSVPLSDAIFGFGHPPLSYFIIMFVMAGGALWLLIDLFQIRKPRARGTVTVHALVGVLLLYFYFSSQAG